MVDLDGRIATWSKGAEQWLGYASEEAIGRHGSMLYPDDDPASAATGMPGRSEGEVSKRRIGTTLLRKDGSRVSALVTVHPVYSPSGEQLGYSNIVFPHGDEGTGWRESRFSEEQFRMLVQGVVDYAIYMLDLDGCVHTWNSGAERIKGYTAEEIIGTHFSVFYTEADRLSGQPQRGLAHAREHGRFENQAWRVRKDGSLFWAQVVIDRIDDDEGRTVGFAKVTRDATENRIAEDALEEMRKTLRQAQKMEAIGQLTGGIAHDFNNLLQVITGNLQLLEQEVVGNERALKRVSNAMAGVARGSKLASQLLAFGRRQPLAPKVINPGKLVRNMGDLLRRTLGDGIEIETTISGGLWNASIDPANLENAILNLAINARDAMEGNGKLTMEAGNTYLDDDYAWRHHELKPGEYVLIAVTDTGCGVAPELADKVFDPFFTTKPEGSGTGLGLSMVYGFVKQSGGHIKIYSEVGHGTTVKLYLPRSVEAEYEPATVPIESAQGGTESILVVEDDEAVRETAVSLLRNLGYTVFQASDAQAALAVIDSGIRVDLLFTDVVMPGEIRSSELAKRARERIPGVAVLFTSGYTQNAIVHAGRLDEGVQLLSKPYTYEALARKIRQILSERQTHPAHEPAAEYKSPPKLRLLFCEDEALILSVVQDILEAKGYDVVGVGSAEEALQCWETEPKMDLLITDLSLPGMSGMELARRLRESDAALPVIFATGYQENSEAPSDGKTLTIVKPYGANSLVEAITFVTAKPPQ
ncbi:MAG: response regulator [Pseudomonadota bacterium]|nr:response regulator [Pseudomonadota bacterium]